MTDKSREKRIFSPEEAEHIAELAKLGFSESELKKICADMSDIIAFASKLSELCTEGDSVETDSLSVDSLREDISSGGIPKDELISAAATSCDGFITVPRVIGEGKS